jgi:5'-methylthioadenosine phosphorylase
VGEAEIGIIGGTGLYQAEALEGAREVRVETPFGAPSDAYMVGTMRGRKVAFLARHGRGHVLLPTEVNYRANVFGFKMLGVGRLISASAVGSMREEIHPMDVVTPDQFYDRTRLRPMTFFGNGIVAHVSLADPVCPVTKGALESACEQAGARLHRGGTYVCIEGPQFSTRAESQEFRRMGVSVIGMTNLPEARLAREAEICYATLAMATDYDCWHVCEEPVTVETVVEYLRKNADTARKVVAAAVAAMPVERRCACADALSGAILTDPAAIPRETREKLKPILARHLS